MGGSSATPEARLERVPPQDRLVRREALFDRLSGAPPGGVVLVCGPAGSGKTVLLRSWVEAAGLPVAWVTVEPDERDAQHFWLSVIDELANAAGGSLERVAPTPQFRGEAAVERLLSGLDSLEEPTRAGDRRSARAGLGRGARCAWSGSLGRLPANLRVVLTSREEPQLGLHRLRLTGELTEIRGTDLRFSHEETRELLEASGIAVSDEAVALLHERTEGWAAGLRLAAILSPSIPTPSNS